YNVVTGIRSSVAQSRRGGEVRQNEASLRVEIVPPTERDLSSNQLFRLWEQEIAKLEGFSEVRLLRSRFGSDSGSAIEIEVRENDDEQRQAVIQNLLTQMRTLPALA